MRTVIALVVAFVAVAIGLWMPNGIWSGGVPLSSWSDTLAIEGGTLNPLPSARESLPVPSRPARTPRRHEPYIVIDRYANKLYLRTSDSVLMSFTCSTGSGAQLEDSASGRRWKFETPGGVFVVHSKLENPWWRKPDWAYIEEGDPIPVDERERVDPNMMGDYAIGFGDGYYIHGTIYERLLGIAVTHGCVRLGADDLRELYATTPIGTLIYVY